ncbi:hypothetical protein M9Y10_016962 [Tritrichomonas musculus]|uniref:DUF4209 domain-containing protein n=1 Tax=Tritrichomonas musculus TaxID=1915356 RepID=A0ABR2HXL0_9EUKA
MKNEEEIAEAKAAFINKKVLILPTLDYLLIELSKLQDYENENELMNFNDLFEQIKPEMTVHEVAYILGKCKRDESSFQDDNLSQSFLESLHLFCDIEAKIRFSLWPTGLDAPHHFSKMLLTTKVQSIISKHEILCILAILADPKGLNLRNIVTHGFSFDTRLSLPLLKGLSMKILPKLPEFYPPLFEFKHELSLLRFQSHRLSIEDSIQNSTFSIDHFTLFTNLNENVFPLFDDARIRTLHLSHDLYNQGHFVDSLLLLFPILEHSIRRAAVAIMDLPVDRLCASPEEHFLSIPEALEAFPEPFKNMTTDLLFIPSGPRIRDRIMHGAIREIPKEFAFCVFAVFEKFTQFYSLRESASRDASRFKWDFAFHPARCLEYEIAQVCFTQSNTATNSNENSTDTENMNLNSSERNSLNLNSSERNSLNLNSSERNSSDVDGGAGCGVEKFRREVDLLKIYNSQTFERMIECVSALKQIKNSWKDSSIRELFDSCQFNRFVCACVLHFTVNNVKSGTLQHLSGLVHSIIKFEATNDVPRFKKACETRMKAIKNHLPFIPKDSKCTFSEIENWINDEELFERALSEVVSKTS